MRRTVETIYKVGEASRTERTITDDAPYWRYIMWYFIAAEALGAFAMTGLILVAVARRHGWL